MRLIRVLPWWAVALALLLAAAYSSFPELVQAQSGIEVLTQGAESKFPEGIRFFLTARSPNEIDDIRVFFKTTTRNASGSYRNVDFQPGREVTGDTLMRAGTGSSYVPPGTTLEYSFEIRDKAGNIHRTEKKETVYLDSRFKWLTVSDDLITVYYSGEFIENRARLVLESARQALDKMGPVLGTDSNQPLRIVAYNNYRSMSGALPFRSQTTSERLITQGMAFGDERVLLVHAFDASVKGTTSHEFTHLLVHEAAGHAISQMPSWLNEGLAEYGNIDPTTDYDAALRYGVYTRRLKPLWFLGSFGGDPNDIIIAYGQGRSVVKYLIDKHGTAKIAELMRAMQETMNIDLAMKKVYGFDQYGLDTQWRATIGLEALPPPAELERRLQELQQLTPTPTSPTAEPTPLAQGTSAAPAGDNQSQSPPSSGGCSAPHRDGQGRAPTEVATLLLLAAPLAMLSIRSVGRNRRRRRGSGDANPR